MVLPRQHWLIWCQQIRRIAGRRHYPIWLRPCGPNWMSLLDVRDPLPAATHDLQRPIFLNGQGQSRSIDGSARRGDLTTERHDGHQHADQPSN